MTESQSIEQDGAQEVPDPKSAPDDEQQRQIEQQKKLLAEISWAAAEHGCAVRYPIHHGLMRRRGGGTPSKG